MILLEMLLQSMNKMVAEAEPRDPNSFPSQPRYPHRGGLRRRRHQGENIFKLCGQHFRLFFWPKNALRTGAELWELFRWRQHWELSEESFRGGLHQAGDRPEELQDQQDKGINCWVLSLWPPSLRLSSNFHDFQSPLSSRPLFSAWSSSHPSRRARLPWRPVPKNGGLLDTI